MARFNFRHGIARRQEDGFGNGANLQPSNGGTFIDIIVAPDPTIFIASHYDVDYMLSENTNVTKAWGPFNGGTNYFLYWDVDLMTGELTRGYTIHEPRFGVQPPPNPSVDQHWFDNNQTVMKVWTGSLWTEKIRVFACKYQQGASIIDFPIGTQVGINNAVVFAGAILFDNDGKPLQQFQQNRRGRFITTESPLHSQFSRIGNFRVEAAIIQGKARENIPIHHCVAYAEYDEVVLARNLEPEKPCIGLAAEDMNTGEVRSYITKGFITNEIDWDWSDYPVGTPIFVGASGNLLPETPPLQNFIQKVGVIINRTTIYVNIGEAIRTTPNSNLTPIQIDRLTGHLHAHGRLTSDSSGSVENSCGEMPMQALCPWGYSHNQTSPTATWIVTHNLNSSKLISDVYDANGFKMIPTEFVVINENIAEVRFETPEVGSINLVALKGQI